jgi:CRISPR-associated protein Csb1
MNTIDHDVLEEWANNPDGPVALVLKQQLEPIDDKEGIIFPPTYADIGYCIDEMPDGRKMAQIDSVGSQANRMEPLFLHDEYKELVPQIDINLGEDEEGDPRTESLLLLAHRAGDAVIRSTEAAARFEQAFLDIKRRHDATALARLAPTSLVFGVWDSRGTQVKQPRLVRSVIRAKDVQEIHTAAQFNSVWKSLDEDTQDALKKAASKKKVKLSEQGFADAPAVWRKTKAPQFKDGKPNTDARILGGIIASGDIIRTTTVNLIALRAISGANDNDSQKLRRYLLGLSLLAATADMELYLREGCLLRYAGEDEYWQVVERRGSGKMLDISSPSALADLLTYTKAAAEAFGIGKSETFAFDIGKAKTLLKKETGEEAES